MRLLTLLLAPLLALPLLADGAGPRVIAREGKGMLIERPDGQRVLHLKGTPYEMGFQHGRLLKDWVVKNCQRINDNQEAMGKEAVYKAYKVMRPLMHARLRPHIPKRFVEEMKGLAAGAGVKFSDVEAANLFPAAFHCSGMAFRGKATHDGSLYHVRILDYMTNLGVQDTSLVIIYEPNGYKRWLNVGFAGLVGSVTGMNQAQVAIGEMGGRGLLYWNGVPMTMLIRDALERAGDLDAALKIFRESKRTCEYYYVISDGKSNRARGIWATGKTFRSWGFGDAYGFTEYDKPGVGAAGNKVFVGGSRVNRGKYHIEVKGEGAKTYLALPPRDAIVLSGFDRYQHFMKRMDANYGKIDAPRLIEMIKRPVSMKSNLHNAIFHPGSLTTWVAVASDKGEPACNQRYYRFVLRSQAEVEKSLARR